MANKSIGFRGRITENPEGPTGGSELGRTRVKTTQGQRSGTEADWKQQTVSKQAANTKKEQNKGKRGGAIADQPRANKEREEREEREETRGSAQDDLGRSTLSAEAVGT